MLFFLHFYLILIGLPYCLIFLGFSLPSPADLANCCGLGSAVSNGKLKVDFIMQGNMGGTSSSFSRKTEGKKKQ